MAHTYNHCLVHFVFSTKGRARHLDAPVRERLWPFLGGIAKANGAKSLAVGGTEDHVHALLSLPPTLSTAKVMQLVKGGSSKWLRTEFSSLGGFSWQEGYGAFSVSVSQVSRTVTYIRSQPDHHRTRTFEEEFVAILKKQGIEYDPEYGFG